MYAQLKAYRNVTVLFFFSLILHREDCEKRKCRTSKFPRGRRTGVDAIGRGLASLACLASCTKNSVANDTSCLSGSTMLVLQTRFSFRGRPIADLAGGSALTSRRTWRRTSCPFTPVTVVGRESASDPPERNPGRTRAGEGRRETNLA
jgi:hypothetical protein